MSAVSAPQSKSDAAYDAAKKLIEQHVNDPSARFNILLAVIEYGKQSTLDAIEDMAVNLGMGAS